MREPWTTHGGQVAPSMDYGQSFPPAWTGTQNAGHVVDLLYGSNRTLEHVGTHLSQEPDLDAFVDTVGPYWREWLAFAAAVLKPEGKVDDG